MDPLARTFDLLVVGGGINGAAIARDAAMRGLAVLLVEREDWGWGTSSRSSKLAHGGLRYLELFEFGLVHEALQDRERFLRDAPHLVRPLRFLYPIYPHVASRRTVKAGLWLYDLLSHGKSVPGREALDREATLALAPGLAPEGLTGGATFYDAQIEHVERLVMEMVLDARAHGAVALNHTALVRFTFGAAPDGGRKVAGAVLRHGGKEREVRALAAVNATGCWVDEALGELAAGKPPKVRKTKGIHVVVPRFTQTALIVKAARDGRTFFILPWRDHCVLGTTDTDYTGDAGDAVAEEDEVRYLVEEARRYFPQAPLDRIEYTYAGVRALVNEQGLTESNVTRRHILFDHGEREGVGNLWSLQGGKITTARSLGEEAVDRVARALGMNARAKLHPTREATYPGAPEGDWPSYRRSAIAQACAQWRLGEGQAAHLVDVYGKRWLEVVSCDGRPDAMRPITDGPHLYVEVTHAVRNEQAATVGDVMLRRTTMGLAHDGNPEACHRVAAWMARLLGWDDPELERQLHAYAAEARRLQVPGKPPVVGVIQA